MKIHYIYTVLICAIISLCAVSCDEDVNDWPVDPNYQAPFRSTKMEVAKIAATAATLEYNGVVDPKEYIFEFSEDSAFSAIVRTVTILADTLTLYSDNVVPTKRSYRTLFEDLKGTQLYAVRMKAMNINNEETGYVVSYFTTPAEQVMINNFVTPNSITLLWEKDKQINKVLYGLYVEDEETVYEEHMLTAEELAAGAVTLTGLVTGTKYDVRLMLDEQQRGYGTIATSGVAGSEVLTIDPAATGESINTLLTEQVGLGKTDIVLVFPVLPDGAMYEIGQLNVPDNINSLCFASASTTSEMPKLFISAVRLGGAMEEIKFQNISIDARKNGFFFNIDNAQRCFKNVSFEGCEISNLNNSLVRLGTAVDVDNIIIRNCILSNVSIGGWGVYNSGNADTHVKLFSFTDSTIKEVGDQFADVNGTHDMFVMNNITFCNYTTMNLTRWFLWRKVPGGTEMLNNLFTGTNGGKVLEMSYSATGSTIDFTSSYKTNEWASNKYPFTNMTEVEMSGEDLFVDPRNGDFHIKDGVRFAGANKVGDPRWWEK